MTRPGALGVIILAAGKGKRMNSPLPKVLHSVGGRPMIQRVVQTAKGLKPRQIVVIVGDQQGEVRAALAGEKVTFVDQEEQLGTGHAVLQAKEIFANFSGSILILSGDVPLLTQMTLDKLVERHYVSRAAATVLSAIFDNPKGYGRIIRNGDGTLDRIVEEKDSSGDLRRIREVNTGVYVFDAKVLYQFLPRVTNDNAPHEYYLPDVLPLIRSAGQTVVLEQIGDCRQVAGVNSVEQLNEVNRIYAELNDAP